MEIVSNLTDVNLFLLINFMASQVAEKKLFKSCIVTKANAVCVSS